MCGIFGAVCFKPQELGNTFLNDLVNNLFLFSETRGKEAAGIAIRTNKSFDIYKEALRAKEFIKNKKFKAILNNSISKNTNLDAGFSFIGHSRLVTNGAQSNNINNQPILTDNQIGIHNGIITNELKLWSDNKDLKKETELDTEIFFKLLYKENQSIYNFSESLKKVFSYIEGTASIASFSRYNPILSLATNTGSIYFLRNIEKGIFIFASERFILRKLIKKKILNSIFRIDDIIQLKAFHGLNINLNNKKIYKFVITDETKKEQIDSDKFDPFNISIVDHSSNPFNLKRCKKCILPETYPYMDFDSYGVCRYCRNHKKFKVNGLINLKKELNKYKSSNNNPDCIVALSGGRDSCYGLHYLKKELGMNPIAFTYDWGFVTDLARRNAARVCGKLGVELIIRSPNINMKRKFVRQNVKAWLKKPELGMIPLFMAGDKAFYYHANQLKKETGIKLVIFCSGNSMEKAYYKFGLSGLKEGDDSATLTKLGLSGKIGLLKYYGKNFIKNPYYINSSLIDSAAGFFHTFIGKEDSLKLYQYLEWDEKTVVDSIINEYAWETSPETETTWRIGDATAAFYNYIYFTVAGFTEDDDMLSNMIREDYISREEALEKSLLYGKPRYDSIKEYLEMINLNYNETLNIINSIPKLY